MLMLHREAVSNFTFLYSIRIHWERLGAGSIWQRSRLQGLLLLMLHEFAMAVRQCMTLLHIGGEGKDFCMQKSDMWQLSLCSMLGEARRAACGEEKGASEAAHLPHDHWH